jgi:hypothetical protein
VLDLIRHPVPRTDAAIRATVRHYAEEQKERMPPFLNEHAQEILELERRHKVDFAEPRALAALHVFRQGFQNDTWAHEIRAYPRVSRLLFERLQQEPEYFAHAFYRLTQGRLAADQAYLDRVYATENMQAGRQSAVTAGRPPGARAQWAQWSSFEREEFSRACERLRMPRLYAPFGYDFSFVPHPSGGSWFGMTASA